MTPEHTNGERTILHRAFKTDSFLFFHRWQNWFSQRDLAPVSVRRWQKRARADYALVHRCPTLQL